MASSPPSGSRMAASRPQPRSETSLATSTPLPASSASVAWMSSHIRYSSWPCEPAGGTGSSAGGAGENGQPWPPAHAGQAEHVPEERADLVGFRREHDRVQAIDHAVILTARPSAHLPGHEKRHMGFIPPNRR